MKNLKILAIFIFTIALSTISIDNADANENEGEVFCYSASELNPDFDYYDCSDCKKVDGRKASGAALKCNAN